MLKIAVLFMLSTKSQPSFAFEMFEKAPLSISLNNIETNQPTKFEIDSQKIYVIEEWATWCSPCVTAQEELLRLKQIHPNIQIISFSREGIEVLRNHRAKMRNSNAAEMFHSEADLINPKSLPAAVLIYNGKYIWRGNPIYPKGELDKVLDRVFTGKFEVANEETAIASILKAEKSFDRQQKKSSKIAKTQLAANNIELRIAKKLLSLQPNYLRFRQYHDLLYKKLLILDKFIGGKSVAKDIEEAEKQLMLSFEKAAQTFAEGKDETAFLARDIYRSGYNSILFLELADTLALRAEKMTRESQFPSFILQIAALRLKRLGKFELALEKLNQGKKIALGAKLPDSAIKEFDDEIAAVERILKDSQR